MIPSHPTESRLLAVVQAQNEIMTAGLEKGPVLDAVARHARTITGAGAAVVELADGDQMLYAAVDGKALPYLGMRLARQSSLSGKCLALRTALRCDDAELDPRVDRIATRKVGARSMILVPLLQKDGGVEAVLKVYDLQPARFDDEDVGVLMLLAGFAGNALLQADQAELRKAAHAAVRESEERFRLLFERSVLGTVLVDEQGAVIAANPAMAAITGLPNSELIGTPLAARVRELASPSGGAFEHFLEHHSHPSQRLVQWVQPDGRVVWALASETRLGEAGPGARTLQQFEDVSALRQAINETARQSAALRSFFDAAPLYMGEVELGDDDFRILRCNERTAKDLFHRSVEDSRGRTGRELGIPERPRLAYLTAACEALAGGAAKHFEHSHDFGQGARKLSVTMVPLPRVDPGDRRVFFLIEDCTEREALKARAADNERLATVGWLAAGVAHEINNPLAFVGSNLGFVSDALRELEGPLSLEDRTEVLAALSEARGGVVRIRDIVRDLLALARPDLSASTVNLDGVVTDAVRMVTPRIGSARVEAELGTCPMVRANPDKLAQVVMNLVVNAAHAIDGTPEGRIRIRTLVCDDRGVIEVEDNGKGIAPEHLKKIFEPFFTTKRGGAGTGLGLAISQGIVSSFGGTLEVRSDVGAGAVFTISLPSLSAA
jgi:PAS domain S-box-containing protein